MNESNYDKHLIPKVKEEEPVEVTVSIMIIRVHSVSDSSMVSDIQLSNRLCPRGMPSGSGMVPRSPEWSRSKCRLHA